MYLSLSQKKVELLHYFKLSVKQGKKKVTDKIIVAETIWLFFKASEYSKIIANA